MYTWPYLDARSRVGRQDRAPGVAAAVSSRLQRVGFTWCPLVIKRGNWKS